MYTGMISRMLQLVSLGPFTPVCVFKSQMVKTLKFTSSASRLPILTLYTKHPCPLCEDAKESLLAFQHLFTLQEVDITELGNKEWFKKYRYDIPVFHFEGEFLMKHKVDFEALKSALKKYQNNNAVS